jgi:hypothetical protein
MKKQILLTAAVCWGFSTVLAAPPGFSQVSTSPGKKVAFETAKAVPLPLFPGPVLTASIVKGKKRHVITVDAMVRVDLPGAAGTLSLGADVNQSTCSIGFSEMHPRGSLGTLISALQECTGVGFAGCTVTATLILDLDAAEVDCPGSFIKQPLTITLWAGDAGPGGLFGKPVDVSMVVRMEKK